MFSEDRPRRADRVEALLGPVAIGLGVVLCAFAVPAALRTPAPPTPTTTTTTATAAPTPTPTPTASTPAVAPTPVSAPATGPTVVGLGDTGISSWYPAFCTAQSSQLRGCSTIGGPETGSAVLSNTYTDVLPAAPDLVLLVDGNADLVAGVNRMTIIANLTAVVVGLQKQKMPVVLATVLPDDARAAEVVALNRSLRALAKGAKVPLLDLAAVTGTDAGRWRAGLSDDGQTPNAAGISALVEAAAQLAESARV